MALSVRQVAASAGRTKRKKNERKEQLSIKLTMKTHILAISSLAVALAAAAPSFVNAAEKEKSPKASKSTGSSLSAADQKFIKTAAQGGMTEVQLGQLASTKGMREDVKAFGAQMVKDHGQANDELKTLASAKGITLEDKLDAKHAVMVDKFSKMEGAQFDKAYIDDMVADHKKDAAEFDEEAKNAKDPELKAFAEKTATVIHSHLDHIQSIQKAK